MNAIRSQFKSTCVAPLALLIAALPMAAERVCAFAPFQDGERQASTPASKVRQIAWRGPEGTLEVFDNSDTYGSALDINSHGAVLGVHEIASGNGMVLSLKNFYCDEKVCLEIPLLEGFSNVTMSALSDEGSVVGFASRPPGNPNGSLIGAIWEAKTKTTKSLPPIKDDIASHAMDISSDGNTIVGYSTGAEPPRIRPCVWTRGDDDRWTAIALETKYLYNPYIVTGGIRISDDGTAIAACCTEKTDGMRYDNHILLWRKKGDGWPGEQVSDVSARIGHVTNEGRVAINMPIEGRIMPCIIREPGKVERIELLEGDVQGEAKFIDAAGVVYGGSDDPPGPVGGPSAFAFKDNVSSMPSWATKAYYSTITGGNAGGQLIGNIDVVVKGGSVRLPGKDKELIDNESDSGSDLAVKTLAFRWTPAEKNEY